MNNVEKLEEWKDIKGYEGMYLISNFGRVMTLSRERSNGKSSYRMSTNLMRQTLTTTGYYKVELTKNKNRKSKRVHRLVAEMFVANPYKYSVVNHIDGNPLNNYHENLEWCTQQDNVIHALDTGMKDSFYLDKKSLSYLYLDKNMSPNEIAELFGISRIPIDELIWEYGIKKEHSTKYGITENYLIKELQKNRKISDIAKEVGCDQSLISMYKKRIEERGYIYGTK